MSLCPRGYKQGPHEHPADTSTAMCTVVRMVKYFYVGKQLLPQLNTCPSLSPKTLTFPLTPN